MFLLCAARDYLKSIEQRLSDVRGKNVICLSFRS